jgi:hypothetical protein
MKLSYYCEIQDLNWSAVVELPSCLHRFHLETTSAEARLSQFSESVTMDSLEPIVEYIKRKGNPRDYEIFLSGTEEKLTFMFSLVRGTNIHDERYLIIKLSSKNPEEPLNSIMEFLGLHLEEPIYSEKEIPRKVFIAHRFDDIGEDAANKVAFFLTLLGFECLTGRGYAPSSVAEKVKSRLQAQAVVVVVLTPGEESTWLVQESLLSNLAGKPLILVKEVDAIFKAGLLADHEYIPFSAPHIEQAFIPLLEGLRALGFQFTKS